MKVKSLSGPTCRRGRSGVGPRGPRFTGEASREMPEQQQGERDSDMRESRQGIVQVQPGLHDPRVLPFGDVGICRPATAVKPRQLASMKLGCFRRARAHRVRQQAARGPNSYEASVGMPDNSSEGRLRMNLNRPIPAHGNRGRESYKSNRDCTIRASCRSENSGSAGPQQRAYRVNWRA